VKPSLGRVVIYTRTVATGSRVAEEYAARITRVVPLPIPDSLVEHEWKRQIEDDPTLDGLTKSIVRTELEKREVFYDVFLAVDVHVPAAARGEVWFPHIPIPFDAGGAGGTWRWPERV